MATRGEAESQRASLEEPMVGGEAPAVFEASAGDEAPARDEVPACVCSCFDVGVGIVVFVAIALIVANYFSRDARDVSLLEFAAAWSFICLFPLLQVSLLQVRFFYISFGEPAREVEYQLSGFVVEEKARQDLRATGRNLVEDDVDAKVDFSAESSDTRPAPRPAPAGALVVDAVESAAIQTSTTAEPWRKRHIDACWYRVGGFSLGLTILKALLNIFAVVITPIQYNLFEHDRDAPGWLGRFWVVSIEFPYMIIFLLPYFICTAMQVRGAGKVKAIVRLSGLLKSLARFSALNLLEFIRLDDFLQQHWTQKMMSVIGAVIGFMAFRGKVTEIAFVANQHFSTWTWTQGAQVVALINNLLSIVDLRNKMIFAALETKEYRKDRWLEAVGDHLVSAGKDKFVVDKFVEQSRSWHNFFTSLHHWCCLKWCRHLSSDYFAFQRLVSMGPDDVTRLLEDLVIAYKPSSSGVPSATPTEHPGSNQRKKPNVPQHILDDCWNSQLTNVVAVVRFGLFYVRALAKKETASDQDPEPLQQGKVKRTEEEQKKLLSEKEQMQRKMDNIMVQKGMEVEGMEADVIKQDIQKKMDNQWKHYQEQVDNLKKEHEAEKLNLLEQLQMKLNDSAEATRATAPPTAVPSSEWIGTVQCADRYPDVVLWNLGTKKVKARMLNGDKVSIIEEIDDQFKVRWKDQEGMEGMAKKRHIQALSDGSGIVQNNDRYPDVVLWGEDKQSHKKMPNGERVTIIDEIGVEYKARWKGEVGLVKKKHIQQATALLP